ncbi:MAG: hypothetical protein ACW99Q_25735 [Candidatus Kariarchaeaceae archaeon]
MERSIKVGPPIGELSCPTCEIELRHVIGGNFILKGDWPGKSIKAKEIKERENTEKMLDEAERGQKEANEVLTERRKGRDHWEGYQRHNKPKVQRVQDNRQKGIKSTLPKKEFVIGKDGKICDG